MGSSSSAVVQLVVVVALLAWIMSRRLRPRPIREGSRRWRVPLILAALGLYLIIGTTHGTPPISISGANLNYLVLGSVVCLAFGLLRGTTIRIWDEGGATLQRYSPVTVALWLVTFAVRIGMDLAAPHYGVARVLATSSVLFMFGLTVLGEAAVMAARAERRTAAPGLL